MKFIVIYGQLKVGKQKVRYAHSKNGKIPLWLVDVVATVKNLWLPLDFYQKFMNVRGVTKSNSITFGAADPNSISAKRNADTKKKL